MPTAATHRHEPLDLLPELMDLLPERSGTESDELTWPPQLPLSDEQIQLAWTEQLDPVASEPTQEIQHPQHPQPTQRRTRRRRRGGGARRSRHVRVRSKGFNPVPVLCIVSTAFLLGGMLFLI